MTCGFRTRILGQTPSFSFVIARRTSLQATTGYARSLSLDLLAQLQGFEANGQFRYTPPTHAILAYDQALRELDEDGGVDARGRRYAANHRTLMAGMRRLGFEPFPAGSECGRGRGTRPVWVAGC